MNDLDRPGELPFAQVPMKLVMTLLLVALLTGACGLKGPLYLPPTDAPPADAKAKAEEKK